jgi:hypothetical protein
MQFLANFTDVIDLWWWEGVINYDSTKQYGMFSAIFSGLERGQSKAKELLASQYEKGQRYAAWFCSRDLLAAVGRFWPLCLLIIAFAAVLLVRRWRRQCLGRLHRALHPGNMQIAAASFYSEALALLADHGFKRDPGQTPLEFAHTLGNHPSRQSVLELTKIYNTIRFGPPGMPFNHAEAKRQLHLLRDSLR